MILPGTLVQLVRPSFSGLLRERGVYTARGFDARIAPCVWCDGCEGVSLCGVPDPVMLWSACAFRIIAPPITEADRLEASAPDAPAKPKRVRA